MTNTVNKWADAGPGEPRQTAAGPVNGIYLRSYQK